MKRLALLALAAAFALVLALSAPAFAYTCEFVRSYRDEIVAMPPATRAMWIKRLGISRKQVRQARACLRGG